MNQNPFFTSTLLADNVILIRDITDVFSYLIEGENEAALIDTGTGIGNIAEYVKTLTDKPVKVLITHVHPDHSGGIYSFDESQVYINREDIPALDGPDNSFEERKGYAVLMNGGTCPCSDENIQKNRPMNVNPVHDGDLFDLGGRTLEAIAVPGHTAGSTVYLDRKNRILFLGDAANSNTLLCCRSSTTIETYLSSLERLRTFSEAYDVYLIAHHAPISQKQTVDDLIEICHGLLDGKITGIKTDAFDAFGDAHRAMPIDEHFHRLDGKTGNLVYRPCRIRNEV